MTEEYAMSVADKTWQASQSNHTKDLSLEKDLANLITSLVYNGWNKSRESSAQIWSRW